MNTVTAAALLSALTVTPLTTSPEDDAGQPNDMRYVDDTEVFLQLDEEEDEEELMPAEEGEIQRLTERDYAEVAQMLGVDIASIKAVVEIEAGTAHQGFYAPGLPIINFDLTMFRRFAGRNGINLTPYQQSHAVVFAAPNARKHGSHQSAQQARLEAAREIDNKTAVEGTFWGMFQIGGFNWSKCGAKNIDDFVNRMSNSERDQLDMFARFLKSTGLDKHLQAKNWEAFARGYNGPSYARRGYHTKLKSAYMKYSKTGLCRN